MKLISTITIGISFFFLTGCTTLHTAASKGNVKAIDRLAEEGNDLNEIDDEGMTPLIRAINMNQKESVVALLKSGANVDTPDSTYLNTPLHYAVIQGNSGLVKLLLEKKADSTARNIEGKSPFDLAREMGNNDMAQLLKVKIPNASLPLKTRKTQEVKTDTPKNNALNLNMKPPTPTLVKIPKEKEMVVEKKISSSLSEDEMREKLKKMINGHETKAIRNFLNDNPHAITLIEDNNQRLRYVGPPDWRVIDITEKMKRGGVSEKEILNHITVAKLPYKQFTHEEIAILVRYGLSYKIINTMMNVSE